MFRRLFSSSLVLFIVINVAYAEEAHWMPDPALRKAVREWMGIPADTPLTQAYLQEHLVGLHVPDREIVNLTGLEHATDLRSLGLSRNKISDLSPLSGLTKLGFLVLDSNQISDLSPLAGLVNLEVLRLGRNQIRDVSPLAGLVNLEVLSVSHNQISDLSPLAGLVNLENLWTHDNLDTEFPSTLPPSDAQEAHWMPDPALRKAVRVGLGVPPNRPLTQADLQEHLTGLHAINKGIVDLTGLEHATDLQSLSLPRNKISDLSPLSGLTGLVWLNLGTNQISDLRPLAGLTRLELLGLADNQIEDLSPLEGLVNLKDLNLTGNPIMWWRPFKNSQIYFDYLLDLLRCEVPRLPIEDRISNREYPSIFAFGNIINLPNVDDGDLFEYHDLHITGGARYSMRWYDTEDGRRLIIGNSKNAQNARQEMLSRNPNILLLGAVDLGHDPGVYPEDFPLWLRDENGEVIYSKEWDSYLMDITLPAVHDRAVQIAVTIEACGYDGIFLDEWNEKSILDRVEGRTPPDNAGIFRGVENEFEARMTMLRRIREAVSDDFLILVNSNADKVPHSAPYVNGMFMETHSYGYNSQQLIQIENTLLWGERNLREPRINCLRGTGLNTEPLDTPKNQQWMRVFTTLSLTHSDGYVVLTTGISFGAPPRSHTHTHAYEIWPGHSDEHAHGVDHSHNQQHYWYDFYDAPLGRPVGGDETKGQHYVNTTGETIDGLFIREFTNGWAVYNRSGKEQTITLPMETIGVASGITATQHTLPDLDGEMYLKQRTGTSADINGDGVVNILDLVLVAQHLGETAPSNSKVDVNGDGIVNILDLILIAQHLGGETAAAPTMVLGPPDAAVIHAWIKQAQLENDGTLTFQRGIANLQRLLASLIPEKTMLLASYPNPFNPETWIPYHLANPSDVQITIYDTRGRIIRRLELGHQHPGYYVPKNRAAYWDGRNDVGERVANGIYFYQLQADRLSFLRKMVILK